GRSRSRTSSRCASSRPGWSGPERCEWRGAFVPAYSPARIDVQDDGRRCPSAAISSTAAPQALYAPRGRGVRGRMARGQGGAPVINDRGALSWQDNHPTRKHDVYVQVADQQALNTRIDELLAAE